MGTLEFREKNDLTRFTLSQFPTLFFEMVIDNQKIKEKSTREIAL